MERTLSVDGLLCGRIREKEGKEEKREEIFNIQRSRFKSNREQKNSD
jgi:hypothetical protein